MLRAGRLLLLGIVVTGMALAADVSGKWSFDVALDVGSGVATFVFQQKGEELTGTYSGALGEADLKGQVKEDRIEFSFDADAFGQTIRAVYKGTIASNDAMEGTANYGSVGSGTWKASRKAE